MVTKIWSHDWVLILLNLRKETWTLFTITISVRMIHWFIAKSMFLLFCIFIIEFETQSQQLSHSKCQGKICFLMIMVLLAQSQVCHALHIHQPCPYQKCWLICAPHLPAGRHWEKIDSCHFFEVIFASKPTIVCNKKTLFFVFLQFKKLKVSTSCHERLTRGTNMNDSSDSSLSRPALRIDPSKLMHNPLKKRNRKQYCLLLWALATTKFNW